MAKPLPTQAFQAALTISGTTQVLSQSKLYRLIGVECAEALQQAGLIRPQLSTHSTVGYVFDNDQWARLIADALEIPSAQRFEAILPGRLWDMGSLRINQHRVPWLLATYITLEALAQALTARPYDERPLVITSFKLPDTKTLPHDPYLIDCQALLDVTQPRFRFNRSRLHTIIESENHNNSSHQPVRITHQGKRLYVYDRIYRFTSPRRAYVIKRLVAAWQQGQPKLDTGELLTSAGYGSPVLAHAFSGYPGWRNLIGYNKDGECWLIITPTTPEY